MCTCCSKHSHKEDSKLVKQPAPKSFIDKFFYKIGKEDFEKNQKRKKNV